MTGPYPFIEQGSRTIDTDQLRKEAIPLTKLIGLVAVLAGVPFAIGSALVGSGIGVLFILAAQFVLAVGSALVLMYVITRAIHIADQ